MMPLTLADTGATYTILKVGGKPEVRAHLNDLGFVAGGDVQVITDMMGNLIVMGLALPWSYQPMPALDLGAFALIAGLNLAGTLCIVLAYRRLTNQVRHRLCPGSPWDKSTATSALRRDAACAA